MGIKGIRGRQGFKDVISQDSIKFKRRLDFPDASAAPETFPKLITVGKESGEMFPTIQEAIDSVRDASEENSYFLWISGGYYHESVTSPGYIHFFGNGLVRIIAPDGSTPSITLTGGNTWFYMIDTSPFTGSAPALVSSGGDISLFHGFFRRGISISKANDAFITDIDTSMVGPFAYSVLDSHEPILWSSGSDFRGDFELSGNAAISFRSLSSSVIGQFRTTDSLSANLKLHSTWVLDPYGRPALFLDPNLNYLRMQNGLLATDSGQPTIARNGSSGSVQVWSAFNLLSSGYGPNVNENFATTNNIIDPQIDAWRFS